jgi:peptidyl-prolyl cis-trans isomerase D
MFDFFRKGVASMFAGVLLALLIASFALWGIGDPLSTIGANDVAEIGDEKVNTVDFARAFESEFETTRQQFGESLTKELAIQIGLGERTLTQLVSRRAYDAEAKNLGIRITDDELRAYIFAIGGFQGVDGKFDKDLFKFIAERQGYSVSEFEELLRRDLVRGQLVNALVNNIKAPTIATATVNKYMTELRTAEILTIPASTITGFDDPTNEELVEYYTENPATYMAPEYRDISYIEVSPNDFTDEVSVAEEDIIGLYESRIDEYTKEEERSFIQMLLDEKEQADTAYRELEAGKSFEEVILEKTGSPADENLFEAQARSTFIDTYGEDAAEQVFSFALNGYTAPIETAFGWYIFKVSDIMQGSVTNFEDVKEDIAKEFKLDKALTRLYEVTNRIDEEIAAGATVVEIADNLRLTLKQVKNITENGITPDGSVGENLPLIVDFLTNAFQGSIGDDPELIEDLANKFYVFHVDNIIESKLRDYDEVKDTVLTNWLQNKRATLASEIAQKITSEYTADKTLTDYKDLATGSVINEVSLTRNDRNGTVSANIQQSIFEQNIGSVAQINAADGDGYVLVLVKSRAFNEGGEDNDLTEITNNITNMYQSDVMGIYMNYLYETLPVTVNQTTAQQVLNSIATPLEP